MFSTTTIASSITSPIAAATPPSVIRSKLSPTSHIARNVTSTVTGITSDGDERRPPVAQEAVEDGHREQQADEDRVAHRADRRAHQQRLVVERRDLDVARKLSASARASSAFTSSATATVFAVGCRSTLSSTAGWPSAVTIV